MQKHTPRRQLRDRTAVAHRRVDDLGNRVASVASLRGYAVFLRAMARVLDEVHGSLDRSSELAGVPPRSAMIRDALRSDLDALGFGGAPDGVLAAPAPARSDAGSMGVGYALEGSALGASVLLNEVRTSTAQSERSPLPTAYLSMLVEQRAGRWSAVGESINVRLNPSNLDDAVAGAIDVFDLVAAGFIEFGMDRPFDTAADLDDLGDDVGMSHAS